MISWFWCLDLRRASFRRYGIEHGYRTTHEVSSKRSVRRVWRSIENQTHLPVEELLDRRQPLFPINAYSDFFSFVVRLHGKYYRRDVEVAKYGVNKMYLLGF